MSFATFHDEDGTFFDAKFHPMSWLYILTACMRVSSSFSFFVNNLMSSMYIRWLIFSCDLLSLYPAAHFLSIWFSGIMAIMNSKGNCASPWKIPLWIFVSAMLLPPAVSSTLQVCMVCLMMFITSCDILYILRQCNIQLCGTICQVFYILLFVTLWSAGTTKFARRQIIFFNQY